MAKIELAKTGEADVNDEDSTLCGQHCLNLAQYDAHYDAQEATWSCYWFNNVELEYDEKADALKRCEECLKQGKMGGTNG